MWICKKKSMIATTTPQANEQQEQVPLLLLWLETSGLPFFLTG
jgi:hypothetical protein